MQRIGILAVLSLMLMFFQSCGVNYCEEIIKSITCGKDLKKEIPLLGMFPKADEFLNSEKIVGMCKEKTTEEQQKKAYDCLKKVEKTSCAALDKVIEEAKKIDDAMLARLKPVLEKMQANGEIDLADLPKELKDAFPALEKYIKTVGQCFLP